MTVQIEIRCHRCQAVIGVAAGNARLELYKPRDRVVHGIQAGKTEAMKQATRFPETLCLDCARKDAQA